MRRLFFLVAAGWLVYLLDPLSRAGLVPGELTILLGITVFLGALSLVLVLTRRPISPLGVLCWLPCPVAAAGLVLLSLSSQSPANPLLRARFQLSRSALDEAARGAVARRPVITPAWIGLFPFYRVDVYQGEVRFLSEPCRTGAECGFAYNPNAVFTRQTKARLQPLDGLWYHVTVPRQ